MHRFHLKSESLPTLGDFCAIKKIKRRKRTEVIASYGKELHYLYQQIFGEHLFSSWRQREDFKANNIASISSSLLWCSQAKVKTSPVSLVTNSDASWKAGRALEIREGEKEDRLALGLWQSLTHQKPWQNLEPIELKEKSNQLEMVMGWQANDCGQLSQRVQINTMS